MVEGDSLHPPANVEKMRQGFRSTTPTGRRGSTGLAEQLRAWAAAGRSGVVTCSALKRAYRERILAARPDVRFVYLKGSEAVIAAPGRRAPSRVHARLPAAQPVRDAGRAACRANPSSRSTRTICPRRRCRRSSTRSASPPRRRNQKRAADGDPETLAEDRGSQATVARARRFSVRGGLHTARARSISPRDAEGRQGFRRLKRHGRKTLS